MYAAHTSATHTCMYVCHTYIYRTYIYVCVERRGGGLGSRPKKMYGEYLGDGVEYHLIALRPIVKNHLRRGVGLIKFLKMVLDPRPPPLVERGIESCW